MEVDADKLTPIMKDLYGRQMFTVDQLVCFQTIIIIIIISI